MTGKRGWHFWTSFGKPGYRAVAGWGPFPTRAVAQAAQKIVLRSGRHRMHCSIEQTYDVPEPNEMMSVADIRKRFRPKPQYCYGSMDGRKHDKGRTKCGCGKLIPTARMVRARLKRISKLQAQVKALQEKIRRMER